MNVQRLCQLARVCCLGGCALTFAPRTVVVSQEQVQRWIERQFRIEMRLLEWLDVRVCAPRLTPRPETNRIASQFELSAGDRLFVVPRRADLVLDWRVRFETSDNSVRVTTAYVERFEIDAVPVVVQHRLAHLGVQLAEQAMSDRVIYTLRPQDVQTLQERGLRPSDIRITPAGLSVTLLALPPR